MPYAVIPKGNPIVDATLGATGALTGLTQGMQYNEDVRQKKEAADTQKRQFADEMAFKLHNLKVMQSEGLLTREQETRLKKMDEDWGSSENNLNRVHETTEKGKDRTLEWNKDVEQNITSRDASLKQKQAADNATQERRVANTTQLAQSGQQNANAAKLEAIGSVRSTYGDPSTWGKEAEDAYLNFLYPGEQLNGGVANQIPMATRKQDIADLHRLGQDDNYKNEITRKVDQQGQLSYADAKGKAEGGNFSTQERYGNGSNKLNKRTMTNIVAKDSSPNVGTGLQPIDSSQFNIHDQGVINEIELAINSGAHPILMLPPDARDVREGMKKALMHDVSDMIRSMDASDDFKQALEARYEAGIAYSSNINIQEAAQAGAADGNGLVGEPVQTSGGGYK